jgi:microcystin-dependent protein
MLLKRTAFAVIGLLALVGQALGAGSISLSGSQQLDNQARPLAGGLLYFFQSGTTTPQSAFQDTALTLPFSNPIVLGADGRVPFFYLADGNIKIRLSDSTGVTVVAADSILVIGPSAGGGGGGSVDPTTVYQTGDLKVRYGTGTHTGWVRSNGRTIGSAASGATERANADAQTLFEYLWTTDANLTVSSGRGATANADWIANKTITLPDYRGRLLAGMDDMGNAAASRITSGGSGIVGTTLGAAGGAQTVTLAEANLPAHAHSLSVSGTTASNGDHTHPGTTASNGAHTHFATATSGSGASLSASNRIEKSHSYANETSYDLNGTTNAATLGLTSSDGAHTHTFTSDTAGAHTHTVTSTGTSGNGNGTSAAVNKMPPAIVQHIYIKL